MKRPRSATLALVTARTIKWAGPFLVLCSLCLWPLSYRVRAHLQLDNAATEYSVRVERGAIEVWRTRQSLRPETWQFVGQLDVNSRTRSFQLGSWRGGPSGPGSIFGYGPQMTFPFWQIAILILVPTVYCYVSNRRATTRVRSIPCAVCGYDLTGLPSSGPSQARCPECGTPSAVHGPQARKPVTALLPLWPWLLLWVLYGCEVVLGLSRDTMTNHITIAILAAVAASTLTAAATVIVPSLRRRTAIPLIAIYWFLGNYILCHLTWFLVA